MMCNHLPIEQTEIIIVGAGVAGLAAATVCGTSAIVLEKDSTPGGLVRTENIEGYWFDRVLHLLHIQDTSLDKILTQIPSLFLSPQPPRALIETNAGTTRYPIQLHLNGLDKEAIVNILTEIAQLNQGSDEQPKVDNYREFLAGTFGETLCELFYYPYNRKMWCQSLQSLSCDNFTWNIHRPDYATLLRGAILPSIEQKTYNSNAYYPNPPDDYPVRGMEVLSQGLASQVKDLRLNHEVLEIDPAEHKVTVLQNNQTSIIKWNAACICTLPLPTAINICKGVPDKLRNKVLQLKHNNVYSLAVRIKGPRPDLGHWRYYAEQSLCFTRLIFLHEFDSRLAPNDGWPLLIEIPKPSHWDYKGMDQLIKKAIDDARHVGAINQNHQVLGVDVFIIDPAYVVFEHKHQEIAQSAIEWLNQNQIMMLGRYGRWEYSSMHSVISDGMQLAEKLVTTFDDHDHNTNSLISQQV